MKPKVAAAVLSALALSTAVHAAQKSAPESAAQYPSRPIRVIVPQAPGGSNDFMARYIGGMLSERLGKPVVIDNRPGAGGMIGTDTVAKANPDGYTLLMASTAFAMNPAAMKKLPYDSIKDFDWVATFAKAPVVIIVGPAAPVKSLQELLDLARSKPNYITIASATGGFNHFVSEMFRSQAGIKAEIALYKGGAPALIDVVSGQAHMSVQPIPTAGPHLRSGKVKALAVSSPKRVSAMPDVPTATEAGLPYQAEIWWAWATTAGTPDPLINKLNTEIAAILQSPETAKRLAAEAAEVFIGKPAEIRKMIVAEIAKWDKVARDAGMPKQ